MTVKEIIQKRRYYKQLKRDQESEIIFTLAGVILAFVGMVIEL